MVVAVRLSAAEPETPEGNLSRTMHWLDAGYCVWFNQRHRWNGHLLQGRLGALASGYAGCTRLHPAAPLGVARTIGSLVRRQQPGGAMRGSANVHRRAVIPGGVEPPWARVVDAIALGSQRLCATACARGSRQLAGTEIPAGRAQSGGLAADRVGFGAGQRGGLGGFCESARRLGPRCCIVLGRRVGRLPLLELGKLAGGLDCAVVSKAVARFGRRLASDGALREQLAAFQSQLSK
jgi:hypothetical protein